MLLHELRLLLKINKPYESTVDNLKNKFPQSWKRFLSSSKVCGDTWFWQDKWQWPLTFDWLLGLGLGHMWHRCRTCSSSALGGSSHTHPAALNLLICAAVKQVFTQCAGQVFTPWSLFTCGAAGRISFICTHKQSTCSEYSHIRLLYTSLHLGGKYSTFYSNE